MTSEAMAKAMPVLLNNCSQFLVEYAGDFVTQDTRQFVPDPSNANVLIANVDWGNVTGPGPDNVIDFVVDHTGVTNTNYLVAAKIRWYGLPRDTNGDRIIQGYANNPNFPRALYQSGQAYNGPTKSNELIDVVPLDDVLRTSTSVYQPAAFERELPLPSTSGDYAMDLAPGAAGPTKAAFRYTCVWANNAPTMIRIVLKIEDPAGRLSEGQWYEYVVGAP
jgi:hypothetical protein